MKNSSRSDQPSAFPSELRTLRRITSNRRSVLVLVVLLVALGASAQTSGSRIGYVYPAGGKQGTVFSVTVGGQFLEGVASATFTGTGVTAELVEYDRPLNQKQINDLRDRLRELQDKRASIAKQNSRKSRKTDAPGETKLVWTPAEEKELAEIRTKMEAFQRRPSTPAIAESAILRVTVESNAPAGPRELRLVANQGLSNPLLFYVGTLPEITEPRPAQENYTGRFRIPKLANEQTPIKSRPPISFTAPATINGQIFPSEVDRYQFHARQGQSLIAVINARDLIPYLADAVPGWFQATLAVYDDKGRELAYDDDFRFHPDPVLHLVIPRDGEYTVEIKDAIYRGREDFVYRLTVGELPYLTGSYPLGAPAGAEAEVDLQGWNLTTKHLKKAPANRGSEEPSLLTPAETGTINALPFARGDLPEVTEKEPNNNLSQAQVIPLGTIVNGRIDSSGDTDVFELRGEAGKVLVAEVTARRLGSPLDSLVKVVAADGRVIAINDDFEDKGAGLETHHADSYVRVALPTNGLYYVFLSDSQGKGGPEFAYRLRLSTPRPDFELRLVPSSLTLRTRVSQAITCYALRKDGFTNQIKLTLLNAPAGYTLTGGTIPAGQDQVRATLSAPPDAEATMLCLKVLGRATIEGREITHDAQPCEDLMQAFFYRHLVPSRDLVVLVRNQIFSRESVRIVGDGPVKIPAGGTGKILLAGAPSGFVDRVQLELSEAPQGLHIEKVAMNRGQAEITVASDASAVQGTRGNLIVNVLAGRNTGAKNAKAPARRMVVGTLPAIPFEIVGP